MLVMIRWLMTIKARTMTPASYWVKLFARWAILTLSISTLLFVAAGTTRLPSLRNFLVTFSAFLLATMLGIDPGLATERSRTVRQRRDARQIRCKPFIPYNTDGCSLRGGTPPWLTSFPANGRRSGLVLFAAAMALQMWAMVVNPFFSPDIRVETERGHRLIACGPYRLLRHPGYLAMLVAVPASALAIGSWLALLPAAAFCLVILKRVQAEEQFLQRNLAGYGEYMGRIRGRLFPRMDSRHCPYRDSVSSTFASQGSTGGGRENASVFDSSSLLRTRKEWFIAPLSACSLSGTAGCQLLLRPGGAALFCFRYAALRVSGFLPKRSAVPNSIFSGSSRKCGAWPRGAGATCP